MLKEGRGKAPLINMNFNEIKQIEDTYQLATYKKMDIAAERGEGTWVWTSEGEKYLDLYGGHAVCATGHSHPRVVKAIQEQSEKVLFYSNLVYSELRARAAEKLVSVAPRDLTKAFFCNSGTEANENAMRMARIATGREKVISFSRSFHGRTADSISATFLGKYRDIGKPNVPGHVMAEFGDIESVKVVADHETAAIILEPIQSMAGVREAESKFFSELRILCDDLGIVLIFDEVQTGIGRTGNWFFAGSDLADAIVPDIISLAKSLGSGIPVGACLVNEKVSAHIKENDLGTTFGGGMLAMAATLATLEAIENDGMIENARRVESHLRDSMAGVHDVVAIHGKGCLLGIEFTDKCAPVHARLLENKIITGTSSNPNVLRLLPPLCASTDQIDLLVANLTGGTESATSGAA
jgi:acetylornithine/N-succinyldiaminopimelate aminotransferase